MLLRSWWSNKFDYIFFKVDYNFLKILFWRIFCRCQFKPTKTKLKHLPIFDDSYNLTGIAKLGIFIRGVFQHFDMFELCFSLVPMQSTITGKDTLESIVAMHQLFVVMALFKNHIINIWHTRNLIKLHCVQILKYF